MWGAVFMSFESVGVGELSLSALIVGTAVSSLTAMIRSVDNEIVKLCVCE